MAPPVENNDEWRQIELKNSISPFRKEGQNRLYKRSQQLSSSMKLGKLDAVMEAKSHAQQVKMYINLQPSATINPLDEM